MVPKTRELGEICVRFWIYVARNHPGLQTSWCDRAEYCCGVVSQEQTLTASPTSFTAPHAEDYVSSKYARLPPCLTARLAAHLLLEPAGTSRDAQLKFFFDFACNCVLVDAHDSQFPYEVCTVEIGMFPDPDVLWEPALAEENAPATRSRKSLHPSHVRLLADNKVLPFNERYMQFAGPTFRARTNAEYSCGPVTW